MFYYMLFAAGDIIDMGFGLSMAKTFENDSAVEVKNIYEAIITLRSAKDKNEVEEIKKAIAVQSLSFLFFVYKHSF